MSISYHGWGFVPQAPGKEMFRYRVDNFLLCSFPRHSQQEGDCRTGDGCVETQRCSHLLFLLHPDSVQPQRQTPPRAVPRRPSATLIANQPRPVTSLIGPLTPEKGGGPLFSTASASTPKGRDVCVCHVTMTADHARKQQQYPFISSGLTVQHRRWAQRVGLPYHPV